MNDIHYSLAPFVAICGADEVGQSTTTVTKNVTCAACQNLLKESRSGPLIPMYQGHDGKWEPVPTGRRIGWAEEYGEPVG